MCRISNETNGTRCCCPTPTRRGPFLSPHFCFSAGKRRSLDDKQKRPHSFSSNARGKSRRLHRYPRRGYPPVFSGVNKRRARILIPRRESSAYSRRKRVNYAALYAAFRDAAFSFFLYRREDSACAMRSVRGNYVLTVQHYRRQGTRTGRRPDTWTCRSRGVIAGSRHAQPLVACVRVRTHAC